MGIDNKYGRVATEHGTIADDEPVFIIRAQDGLAAAAIHAYARLCIEAGSPVDHIYGLGEATGAILAWQETHSTKVPGDREPAED